MNHLLRVLIISAATCNGCFAQWTVAPAGNGALMAASFAPFKPKVRYYWDSNYFYEESDSIPDRTRQPNLMVGITSWQQQVPLPASYFGGTTNNAGSGSSGYLQPNFWRIPLVPVAAASPISLTGNFLRGAVALGADGVPIFNPRNNTGRFSQEIGELDAYGGHCGLGDDYHYHIFPVHLIPVVGNAKPIAWGLDGYPVYGYVEPDGSTMQALDSDGGHTHGSWGYHYHARGTLNSATNTWTPSSPYMMNSMHGTVVNYDSQIDPQPNASGLRGSGTGGYTAAPVAGATITAFKNPVALTLSGGHLVENPSGTPSDDNWLMRYTANSTTYDICWQLNRSVNPKTMTITWRHPTSGTTTTTYANSGNRITAYSMAASSMKKLPDTGQLLPATAMVGEDSDYTMNAPSFTDNNNGTITDNVTGLMWQKTDNGECTWENAVSNASSITTGGYSDWRLPTPSEAFSILNHQLNPALNSVYFTNHAGVSPDYWWTSDIFGSSTTNVWCTNSGGGLGPKPKAETLSAGGSKWYHARYVRGAKPNNGHSYINNGDGTITDTDTNLMWSQAPSSSLSWSAGVAYAEGLALAGYSDWRLPNVKELQSLVDITRATATGATTSACINRTLFPAASATAYWSSTSVKSGTFTEAWLVEFGVNTSANPSRNAQGIVSYEPYTSSYPVFAVRSLSASSITQGRATTTTTNLLSTGQRVSGVGSITATDGTVWTVPAVTQFATGTKAADLYNEVTGVTPAGIGAAASNISNAPTVVVDADGEVVTGYIFADNYFELYVNGSLVAVDPVPYTPFNSCVVKFKAKRPISYAFKLVDWEENLGLGTELNGGNAYYPGDGGLMASFSDGTVTNGSWKAQSFNIAPLDSPSVVTELSNGTHDSSAATTHNLTQTAYALHYAVPSDWYSKTYNDSGWPNATTYTEATVGVNNKPAFTNFPAQFSNSGAQFIWSSNLVLDNEVIVRYTGPSAVVLPPSISEVLTRPNTPTYMDSVYVTAKLQGGTGATVGQAQLTYSNGSQSTSTVFTETMAATATPDKAGWDGSGANNSWVVTNTSGGVGNVKQTLAANHGTGNPCGLDMNKGSSNAAATMVTTTNPINATGTSGYVEFWTATTNLTAGLGWNFQTSTDGVNWTTRVTELTGSNHAFASSHYNLLSTERVSTLKIRFQFTGNGTGGSTGPSVQIDDVKVVTTTGSAAVSLAMVDDGLHGDGAASDGVYGALIPVFPAGTALSYSITITDSDGASVSSATSGSYTVSATTPPSSFAASTTRSGNDVVLQWPSQVGTSYSVQWSADLIQWTNVPVGQTNTWTDLGAVSSASKRFYRVMR